MTKKKCAASSCVVENVDNRVRLSFNFFAMGDYSDAKKEFERNPNAFSIDFENTRGGSFLAVYAKAASAEQACADMENIDLEVTRRDRITCKNGSVHLCGSVNEAITMAFDHA